MTASRAFVAAASVALCIYGAASLTQGLAVPVTARVAQVQLERQFEQRMAQTVTAPEMRAVAIKHRQPDPLSDHVALAAARPKPSLARLGVERLGISQVVRSGEATHDRLAGGPIMIKRGDEASPVTIVSAHRDTHFEFVRDLQAGDVVTLQSDSGQTEHYRVVRFETVRWDDFSYPLNPGRPLLALATCYPFGGTEYGGPWRRVAWAEQVVEHSND